MSIFARFLYHFHSVSRSTYVFPNRLLLLLLPVIALGVFTFSYAAGKRDISAQGMDAALSATLDKRSYLPLVFSTPPKVRQFFLPFASNLFAPKPLYPPLSAGVGYGMQLDPGTDYPRSLKMLKAAGFNWVKAQVRWEDVEPSPGEINWRYLDSIVDTTSATGTRLLFSVVTAPGWSRPAGADLSAPGPPADVNRFASFVGSLAARHKGRVHAYEIWNEQNLGREWGGPGRQNAATYVSMLQASYRAIKAADPSAVVVTGALTPAGTVDFGQGVLAIDDVEYFRQMYQHGMKGHLDAVGVHPSGFNNPPDADPMDPTVLSRPGNFHGHRSFYFRNFERYREVMVQHGDGDKKLWFTEFGWASEPNPFPEYGYAADNTEEEQAAFLVRAFEIARSMGYVGPMFVWNLNYAPASGPGDNEARSAFSVIRPDWSPRPAYDALAGMEK